MVVELGRVGRAVRLAVGAALGLALVGALAAPRPGAPIEPDLQALLLRPGLALRRAAAWLEEGRLDEARPLLAAVASRHPVVADYADLFVLRALVDAERYEEAVAHGTAWPHRDSPTRTKALELLGRAHEALGDETRAREAWERATRTTSSRVRLSDLERRIAESFGRSGKPGRAAETYRHVWTEYPEMAAARAAARALDRLERELDHVYRDAAHTFARAEELSRRYRNEPALAAYDRALALGLPAVDRRRAEEGRARTLFRLRRYPEAAIAYGALPPEEEHRIQRARAHARAGDVPRGARELEVLGAGSTSSQGTRALLIAALLWDGEDAWQRAARLYRQVIDRAPASGAAMTARWRLGWRAYREGRVGEAVGHFEDLARRERDPVAALRPRYWMLRARERRGDADVGDGYAELAREFPLTYYGWRARTRAPAGASVEREPATVSAGTTALRPGDLARVRILVEAGLVEAARDELRRFDARARGLEDRLGLARLHANLGAFDRAQRLVIDGYGELLSRGPSPDLLELWWHAWPAPYEEELRAAAADGVRLEPAIIYSIMREESGYQPGVVSFAGARGLLQLMPETAARVAREVHLSPFSAEDLFDPRVNIRLGAVYLEGLLREFDGRRSAAIASYNAGPGAVARWVARDRGDDDEFVEEIPYDQTRAYVKRVMRSLHAYRVLY